MIFKRKRESSEEKINKSKEIIKEEKKKIKEEKKKLRIERKEKRLTKLKQETYTRKEVTLTIIFSMIIGALACIAITYIILSRNNLINSYKDLDKLIDTYNTISNNYYGDLDKEEIVEAAMNAMIDSVGDNFTTYSNIEKAESFLEDVEGVYEGIGCMVSTTQEGQIVIVSIFEDSPSEKAGLKEGDIIMEVDGKDYTDKNSTDVAEYIKNNPNKKIKMTILRDEKEKEYTITREKVEVPVVSSEIYEQDSYKIGYISISIFSSVAQDQFESKLKELEKEDIEGLVIDVRNNGGGYLTTVTDITNLFLTKGQIIYRLEGDGNTEVVKDTTKTKRTYPIAVLINGESASASEILASAIKESYNGIIVGENSYGKGTVQQTKKLKDGSMIKYTTQNWLTPNGNWINEIGLEPTNKVEQSSESDGDNQLQEALKLVSQKLKK